MAVTNDDVVAALRELATLMKLEEGSPQAFRVRAYEKAVQAVQELSDDVSVMSVGALEQVHGIGKSTARKIREFVETGTIGTLAKLREKYPPEFVELTRIPGVGPKTAVLMRDRQGIRNLDDLKQAIDTEKLRELPGMGAKSEEKIATAIERLGLHGKDRRTPIADALPVAQRVVAALAELTEVAAARYCGSLRRFSETIGDVDVVVAADDAPPVMEAFVSLPLVAEVLARGETKSAVLTTAGLQVDLRVVPRDDYGAALLYFTGSKSHNIALRQRALERGMTLNEYALSVIETEEVVAAKSEEDIYAALELAWIAPELREGYGEVEAAAGGGLPDLVEVADLRGDLHVHSSWSGDGRSSLEDMVEAAARRGLEYLALTDHAEGLAINGLSREQMLEQRAVLADLAGRFPGLTILHGAELNIGPDGDLDYDRDFLLGFDYCVASVHSHFDLDRDLQTARLVTAMSHPAVNAIGHLTGRRIGMRPGIQIDAETVFAAAASTGTAIEVNSHLDRLDAPADLVRRYRGSGVVFAIDTDAHHTMELDQVRWGVATARRGWVERGHVVNTWPEERFLEWVRAKRER